ncbi:MAG: recombinase family protein [Clostridia bacterium]|nr:recombinase family protein [Clostridia bacterium]
MYNSLLDSPANYNAGIYIRLSQEDKNKKYESDSESVMNQRQILLNYINSNGFKYVAEYVDDGYSGTNFDRPGFKKMIEDINDKKINLVIVKDLSRLGRDHVNTGYYMERFFPENRVRFISIMESYDSARNQASNDSSTFIVACNDYYSKQNSNKIRDVLHSKKSNGKFIGSLPSYGYMRDPEDKGHLIPNPETAPTVKKIFQWYVDGVGISEIVTRLNDANVPTPSGYKDTKLSIRLQNKDEWTISSVRKILKNRIYTGDMVQNVQTKINYKTKKKITLDKSLWIIVEDTHEALVDKETFQSVQDKPPKITRTKTPREKRLFENLIFCKECGNFLTVAYRRNHDYWSVNCNRYARDPKRRRCEPHFFPYNYLEEQLLKQVTKTLKQYIKELDIEYVNNKVGSLINTRNNVELDYQELCREKERLTRRLKQVYDDKLDGLLTSDSYKLMSAPIEKNLSKIKKEITKIENSKNQIKSQKNKIPDYTDKIRELLNTNNISRDLLFAIIDKIEIDQYRNVEIKYKFNLIKKDVFKYKDPEGPRNPYGSRGK